MIRYGSQRGGRTSSLDPSESPVVFRLAVLDMASCEIFKQGHLDRRGKACEIAGDERLTLIKRSNRPIILRQILGRALDDRLSFSPHLCAKDDFGVHIGQNIAWDHRGQLGDGHKADLELASFTCDRRKDVWAFLKDFLAQPSGRLLKKDCHDGLARKYPLCFIGFISAQYIRRNKAADKDLRRPVKARGVDDHEFARFKFIADLSHRVLSGFVVKTTVAVEFVIGKIQIKEVQQLSAHDSERSFMVLFHVGLGEKGGYPLVTIGAIIGLKAVSLRR